MFKSILTTALRNIYRNRIFSLINFAGLSVSMSLGMLIILIAKEQFSYDQFHSDVERIYRVNTMALRVEGGQEPYASTPFPLGTSIKENYTFAEDVVRINRRLNGDVIYGNVNVPLSGLMVDPSFLNVFNFPLEQGNPAKALTEPNSLVITQETAERVFGKVNPLGQMVTVSGYGEFTITGVLRKITTKTHFEFQALASTSALAQLEKAGVISSTLEDWNNYYGSYTYFKLKPGNQLSEVEQALKEISKEKYAGLKLETRDKGYEFYLHPLNEITPGPELSNQMGQGMPTFLLIFLSVLAGVVLIMSVFNFTNLMIAKSLSRAREIGVRKVVGAQRFQVFLQFVGETVVFSLVALALSYLLLQFLKTGYLQLPLNEEFAMTLQEDWTLYIYFILFAIGVGVLAGLLPAGYLSAFKPVKVLKDSGNLKVYSRLTFRKVLMVTQFAFSVIFIIVVTVIYRQVDFMLNADYGFNQKNILNVRLQGVPFEKAANEVRLLPGVINTGGVSTRLGTWADQSSDYKRERSDEPFVMREFLVNDVYVNNLELNFVAGRNFDPTEQGIKEKHVILNETALTSFGFKTPLEAVGQSIFVNDSTLLEVIGVTKDFHFRPLNTKIGPLALRYNTAGLNFLSLMLEPNKKEKVIAALEPTWKKLDPIHPLEYMMMEDEIDDAYRQAGMHDILIIVGYISALAVILACLGLLGMAMYATQIRVKEVGVRKVMGASVQQVVMLLSKSFMMLIGIAVVIGIPVSLYFSDLFLSLYAYKMEISVWLVLGCITFIAPLAFLIIASQTWKTAAANPVKSLKYE
jgi:putative ABC transport system permease protein